MSMAATATANVVDPGVKLLAERLASLSDRADWPVEPYGSLQTDDVVAWLLDQTVDVYELVHGWVDVATGEDNVSTQGNPELWLDCPIELTDWMNDRRENGRLLDAIKAAGHRWRPDIEITTGAFLDDLDDDQVEELSEWVDSVCDTLASGGDLTANGGDLLVVPECLRTVVEPIEPAESSGSAESAPAGTQQPPRAETPAEARQRLEEMLPIALRQLRDAETQMEMRKKAYDTAKKDVEAKILQLRDLNEELCEAIAGVAGGDFQQRLPFDRVEKNNEPENAHDIPSVEFYAETANVPIPAESDPIIGSAIHLLTRDQLGAKTNGRSGDAGISDAIADKLGDAGIYTIGQLEALMREKGGSHWYRDLTGIGSGKAEAVCNALEALRRVFPMASE